MTMQHAIRGFEGGRYPNGHAYLVLLEILYRADRKGIVRIGQHELAEHAGISRTTVARSFHDLQTAGLLSRATHGRYQLNLDLLALDLGQLLARRTAPLPPLPPSAADAEEERLKAIQGPGQGIVYNRAGWPSLVDL